MFDEDEFTSAIYKGCVRARDLVEKDPRDDAAILALHAAYAYFERKNDYHKVFVENILRDYEV